MTATERLHRRDAADELVRSAYEQTALPADGVALVAVGGYGRGELAPHSDLDIVLIHDDQVTLGEEAAALWYPLWDSGASIDHSVRSLEQCSSAAADDLRVALGLLDLRHLAGDPNLTLRLRTAVLAQWRQSARDRLPALQEIVRARGERLGELAHAAVPDLKESAGGLRDATVLKALVATWLVDVPHADLERCRTHLLDARDALHAVAGRATDRVAPEHWEGVARHLGLADERAAQRHVRSQARRMTHLSRLTWRRVDAALGRRRTPRLGRRPDLQPLGQGVAIADGEVVLAPRARPDLDPTLLLRAAAEAAERGLVLAPPTAARLAREAAALPDPWPEEARGLLVRLLASGEGLRAVWETLDETGALPRLLPEWEQIRLLPHASVVHRYTVDRHVVETCIEAARLIRRVARPDLLVVAALLHDIGKGGTVDHSVAGEPVARTIARRLGFSDPDVAQIARLVRWHLLLAGTATTRDPEDPATVAAVVEHLPTVADIELLRQLSEADARATAPKAWTPWRAALIDDLARRCLAALGSAPASEDETPADDGPTGAAEPLPVRRRLTVEDVPGGQRVTVVAPDRTRLLADVAAVLALQRIRVHGARAWSTDGWGISVWEVEDTAADPALLATRLEAIEAGRLDPSSRLARPTPARLEPTVTVCAEASDRATVLEVRMDDRPGVVHLVAATLAAEGISVRSAHIATWGPQAVDVFYVQEPGGGPLSPERADAAAHAVRTALLAAVTLDHG
ncbi:[protein-PII] uridylyltransferase [Nocardioides massiliensis]|uniref:Bifunctional uridylyltransferase/uridylyl-removing enzyme n=3 Tax=Nocardioides massiliensis TaxID=1325935 RepID=A0ABT9NQN0_9ACTN|nr:[protein-PII] uridylyltransferase [Nocardioides massiliensis]